MNKHQVKDLLEHRGHELVVDIWGDGAEVTLTCNDCDQIVLNDDRALYDLDATTNCIQCGEYAATHGPLCTPCHGGYEAHDRQEWAETS